MKLKNIMAIPLICVMFGFVGCSSTSGSKDPEANPQAQNPQDKTPSTVGNDTETPSARQTGTAQSDETVAQESFLKTLASGSKKFNLKNIVVEYSKTNTKTGVVMAQWTANCTTSRQATLNGTYPNVNVSIGGFDCGSNYSPSEMTDLQLITGNLVYTAHHIPAYPSEPNQFRLSLQNSGSAYFKWKSLKSLNALTKDRVVYFDFLGDQEGDLDWQDDSNHFLQITFKQSEDGKSETMNMEYNYDQYGQQKSTVIKIKADIERAN